MVVQAQLVTAALTGTVMSRDDAALFITPKLASMVTSLV